MNYTKAKYYTYNGMYDDAVGDFTITDMPICTLKWLFVTVIVPPVFTGH